VLFAATVNARCPGGVCLAERHGLFGRRHVEAPLAVTTTVEKTKTTIVATPLPATPPAVCPPVQSQSVVCGPTCCQAVPVVSATAHPVIDAMREKRVEFGERHPIIHAITHPLAGLRARIRARRGD
jgi:hypothetical protein